MKKLAVDFPTANTKNLLLGFFLVVVVLHVNTGIDVVQSGAAAVQRNLALRNAQGAGTGHCTVVRAIERRLISPYAGKGVLGVAVCVHLKPYVVRQGTVWLGLPGN